MSRRKVSTGIEIGYDEYGSGEPLVLIHGLGYGRFYWYRQVPFLSRFLRLITLDLRGSGDSDKPAGPYSVPQMAQEVADLIAALAPGGARVLGHSLGGFVAQELALSHPDRVRSLLLAGTAAGGTDFVMPSDEALAALRQDPNLSFEANLRRNVPRGFSPGWPEAHPEDIEEVIQLRLQHPITPEVQLAQNMAGFTWPGAGDRLDQLDLPVLVLHGDADAVVPVANGRFLAGHIPGASLRLFPGVGHQLFLEAAPMVNRVVLEFVQGV